MARFEFRDDNDDGEETDYDSPSKDKWDNKPHSRFPANYYGEQEEGEIIEDESIDRMDESDQYEDGDNQIGTPGCNYNQEMNEGNNFSNTRSSEDEYIERDDSRNSESRFGSYFPWRSRRRTSEGSPSSEGYSFRSQSPRVWDNESHEENFRNLERDDINNSASESESGKEKYRLIASTKYDRNYERSDFFPSGLQSNNSHESNNSNNYRTPISDDDEQDIPYNRSYNSDRYTNEDRSNATNGRTSGELVRSSTHQNSSGGAPEVHYHIYVSDGQASRWFDPAKNNGPPRLSQEEYLQDENGIPSTKGKRVLWKTVTVWAAITQALVFLVGRYNLVSLSPPPSYLTWEEYRNHQFRLVKKISKESISLFSHVSRSTVLSAFSRKEGENNNILSPRYAFPAEWKSFVQPLEVTNYDRKNSKTQKTMVFGQDEALEHFRKGLSLWSSTQKMHNGARRSWRHKGHSTFDSLQQQEPLIVYASGGKGLGKSSMAYLLLEQLESHDTNTDVPSLSELCADVSRRNKKSAEVMPERDSFQVTRERYCPLLHLTPSEYFHPHRPSGYLDEDYNRYDLESEESFSPLYQEILDHVIAAGGGASIVVLEKVDSSSMPRSWLRDLMTEVKSQQSVFGNTIFVLTSQIGTNTVEKWRRKRLQSSQGTQDNLSAEAIGNTEVEALLRYEIKNHYSLDSEGDDGSEESMGIENWLLLPMAPLDQSAMAQMLQNIANNNKSPFYFDQGDAENYDTISTTPSIFLTQSASQRILDALEWHQWIHKTSGEVLRIWSPDGAPPLFELWEEHVLNSIENSSSCPRESLSKKATLILDFEGISTDRLWLRSCELVETDKGQFDVTSNDGRRWRCLGGSCSFFL